MNLRFTKAEQDAFETFEARHYKCMNKGKPKYRGSQSINIHLRSTGIGVAVIVKCCHCGLKENISDYDNW